MAGPDATTTLTADIGLNDELVSAHATWSPFVAYAKIRIDDEHMMILSTSGNQWRVLRNIEGSSRAVHARGTLIQHWPAAAAFSGFGGARSLSLTTLANGSGSHAAGDSGPLAAAGFRYMVVGATLTADPGVGGTGLFRAEMLMPDNVTWLDLGTNPYVYWPYNPTDQQEFGIDSSNTSILLIGDFRLRWLEPWIGNYWVIGAR